MLPELPNLAHGQFPILQQWFGFASLLLVVFGIYVSIRKMNRDDKSVRKDNTHQAAEENAFASVPKQYYDGPINKLFELLHEINGRLKDVQRQLKESDPPHRRKR